MGTFATVSGNLIKTVGVALALAWASVSYAASPPGLVQKIGSGPTGAKQIAAEVHQHDGRPAFTAKKWDGRKAGDNTVVTETRGGARPRTRTYVFDGQGDITTIKVQGAAATQVHEGAGLHTYLTRTGGPGTTPGLSLRKTPWGYDIHHQVRNMIEQANAEGRTVVYDFNDVRLTANPGDSPQKVIEPFRADQAKWSRYRARAQQRAAVARAKKLAAFDAPLVRTPPAGMELSPQGHYGGMTLITPAQLRQLPKGTVLHNIFGEEAIVGVDRIDGDTRGGFLAYGFRDLH
jgi:hypothetical protein